jgi:NB-ARC domain
VYKEITIRGHPAAGKRADLDAKTQKLTDLRITSVYYPVTTPDHAALHQLLDALECYDPAMVDQIAAIAAPVPPPRAAVIPLVGQATGFGPAPASDDSGQEWSKLPQVNPGQYVERRDQLRLLDDLASNVRVRIISVLGLGGTGKTTLLRRVFEDKALADARFPDGVVVYPVRDDAQVDAMLDALRDKFPPLTPIDRDDRAARLEHARMILRRRRMLLVLDGIELLQERPGQAQHGRFLSDDLRALLLDLGREGQALVAITSRFATTEFKAHLGLSYRTIDLGGFTPGEFVAFLKAASLSGNDEVLTEVHRLFEGHPLGLTLFAGAVTGGHTSARLRAAASRVP